MELVERGRLLGEGRPHIPPHLMTQAQIGQFFSLTRGVDFAVGKAAWWEEYCSYEVVATTFCPSAFVFSGAQEVS